MNYSTTFCPAKWDELTVNLSANYVYSCCKATPVKISTPAEINQALDQQRTNLFNGIQDKSCEYCWAVEKTGHVSKRQEYLKNFNQQDIQPYRNNTTTPKKVEINLGNECNFQCQYCNPKFSSQWETDVKNKPYKVFSDRFFYDIAEKSSENVSNSIEWLQSLPSIEILRIIGGEPLYNKNFFKVINSVKSLELAFTTNLSCKKKELDQIIDLAKNYRKLQIGVSIDSTDENAEFTRYGLDFEKFKLNLDYLLDRLPAHYFVEITSLMTSVTILDIDNMIEFVNSIYKKRPDIVTWDISYCQYPVIMSMSSLPLDRREQIIQSLLTIREEKYILGVDQLISVLRTTDFNKSIYGQLNYFLKEYSSRKNIKIPAIIDKTIGDHHGKTI